MDSLHSLHPSLEARLLAVATYPALAARYREAADVLRQNRPLALALRGKFSLPVEVPCTASCNHPLCPVPHASYHVLLDGTRHGYFVGFTERGTYRLCLYFEGRKEGISLEHLFPGLLLSSWRGDRLSGPSREYDEENRLIREEEYEEGREVFWRRTRHFPDSSREESELVDGLGIVSSFSPSGLLRERRLYPCLRRGESARPDRREIPFLVFLRCSYNSFLREEYREGDLCRRTLCVGRFCLEIEEERATLYRGPRNKSSAPLFVFSLSSPPVVSRGPSGYEACLPTPFGTMTAKRRMRSFVFCLDGLLFRAGRGTLIPI